MKRNFTNENLEEFLRQNADSLKMQPSDKVWKGISSQLNRRRRRFGFLIGVGLLVTTATGYLVTVSTENNNHKNLQAQISPKTTPSKVALSSASLPKKNELEILPASPIVHGKNQLSTLPSFLNFHAMPVKSGNEVSNSSVTYANKGGDFVPTTIDSYDESNSPQSATFTFGDKPLEYPFTIESVLNSYHSKTINKNFGLQLYFTPTISYRRLNDNTINEVVTHKPGFGFEIGMDAKYRIARNLKLRAGLQFNMTRYEIKTYNAASQLATIRLNNRFGIDSFNTVTNYNNFTGYKSNWLQNSFFQVSAPVGLELNLSDNDKMQFGVASTIQPTYILGDRVFLISSDYKNYAEVPRLIRRWNVNTSFETFVAYSTGKLKWQVGPQVRYQLLSSYVKKYPVKENLFDFGLKVGVSLNHH